MTLARRFLVPVLAVCWAGPAVAAGPVVDAAEDGVADSLDEGAEAAAPNPQSEPAEKKKNNVGWVITDDLEIRWWRRPERLADFPDRGIYNYVEQVNRLTANASFGKFAAYGQLDQVALFFNRYRLDGNEYSERQLLQPSLQPGGDQSFFQLQSQAPLSLSGPGFSFVNVEKLAVQYKTRELDMTVGDFYAAFGRGGALNLNRNTDIDIDTSIQGVKAMWRPGDWAVTAVMGQLNRQQVFQDNPNISLAGDRRHAVAGLRIERYGLGPATVGIHGTAFDFVGEDGLAAGLRELGSAPDVLVGGATGELSTGPIEWAAEADVYAFPTNDAWGGNEPCDGAPTCLGYGAYMSSTIFAGPTTILIEAKRYKNAERVNGPLTPELYEVAILPTLEYEIAITEDSAAGMNSNDITGGLARIDIFALDSLLPYASIFVARDMNQGPLHFNKVDETIIHGLTGIEVIKGDSSVLFNAGLRVDRRDKVDDWDWGADRQIHGDINAKFPLAGQLFLAPQVNIENFQWGTNIFPDDPIEAQQTDYWEMESSVSFMWGSQFAATWFTDYTTNPLVTDEGNLAEDVFGAVEIQYKPTPSWTVKVFGGAYKSGIRCAGGQCRVLPGFNGGRFSVTGTF